MLQAVLHGSCLCYGCCTELLLWAWHLVFPEVRVLQSAMGSLAGQYAGMLLTVSVGMSAAAASCMDNDAVPQALQALHVGHSFGKGSCVAAAA